MLASAFGDITYASTQACLQKANTTSSAETANGGLFKKFIAKLSKACGEVISYKLLEGTC